MLIDMLKTHLQFLLVSLNAQLISWRDNPDLLRRVLRNSSPGQLAACALMALVVGIAAAFLHVSLQWAHRITFLVPVDVHLSAAKDIPMGRVLAVPVLGGLVLGLLALAERRGKADEIIDPIEANAVHGGRMSLIPSLRLVLATFLSNVFGASIGMEAAYTQLGSAFLSIAGKWLHLRREDMRIFVAAGAAAAVAAAFHAPLAGAFYGFEVILGAYMVAAISQVAVAAVCGTLTAAILTGRDPLFALPLPALDIPNWYYLLFLLQGVAAALVGIFTMRAVTRTENLTRRLDLPEWASPIFGGLVLGVMALMVPQVLGGGQGAINLHLHESWPLIPLLVLLLAKILASAISIGSGFRGGLFSASLFIGCLFGQLFALLIGHFLPLGQEFPEIFMLVGMGSVAASIIGAPVTMVLLVLEMTGSFTATTAVLMGVLIASAMTRHYFGYSFSTWRFHLRGLRISGAHDVGWIEEITVAALMREDGHTVSAGASLEEIRAMAAPRSAKRLFVTDDAGQYLGAIDATHLPPADAETATNAASLAERPEQFLLPTHNIRQALDQFAEAEVEELPVLDPTTRRLLGYLSESYALRRYTQELESRNAQQFGIAAPPPAA